MARSLDFDAKVINSKKMKPLAETRWRLKRNASARNCWREHSTTMTGPEWNCRRVLGSMGIRAVTSQLETSFEITVKKTSAQGTELRKVWQGDKKKTRNVNLRLQNSKCGTER